MYRRTISMARTRTDRVKRKILKDGAVQDARPPSLFPSPKASTNLIITDIIVRSASTLFRKRVEKRVARASVEIDEEADQLLDGRTLLKTLSLYGMSKIATRSPLGLGVVGGGLILKTLYDRGTARQKRLAKGVTVRGKARPTAARDAGKGSGETKT